MFVLGKKPKTEDYLTSFTLKKSIEWYIILLHIIQEIKTTRVIIEKS